MKVWLIESRDMSGDGGIVAAVATEKEAKAWCDRQRELHGDTYEWGGAGYGYVGMVVGDIRTHPKGEQQYVAHVREKYLNRVAEIFREDVRVTIPSDGIVPLGVSPQAVVTRGPVFRFSVMAPSHDEAVAALDKMFIEWKVSA